MQTTTHRLGTREFKLDIDQARATIAGKAVINGIRTNTFNLLPIKYQWAYDMYRTMKANHWEPEEVPMQKDIEQWNSDELTDAERWIIRMGLGYFSAAEGIVGDNILHGIREAVTASELKLVLGRHAHEENIHADSLLYMISSLGIDPYECQAMFEQIPTIVKKNEFVNRVAKELRGDTDYTLLEHKQALAKNLFVFGQCMEGTQFFGLFGMILSLYRKNKFPGVGTMFRYTMKDETNHISLCCQLLLDLVDENPDIMTNEFRMELLQTMDEAVELEKAFIRDCLPTQVTGITVDEMCSYIEYVADCRLRSCRLPTLYAVAKDPMEWMSEIIFMDKEANFFERKVTDYAKATSLAAVSDDKF